MGLRERVSLLGGDVRIESHPGRGTALHVQIPLEEGTRTE
jgi:signal transduction histidine kinase